ncbi:hypothetical protein [Okeania sp. KiyG1]|uniref:hypothetical protein n=1 Tax=Okeania sp. KiyG1 TaxID=2720165 RepID=UPI001923191A|nr:hypothetical protein [Okeania sp. KiyG1]
MQSNNYWTIDKTSIYQKHSDRLAVQSNNYWTIDKTSIYQKHSDRFLCRTITIGQ